MMKKLVIGLLLVLMLTGCGETTTPETEPTVVTTQATEPAPTGIYLPDSAVETSTFGAVRQYALPGSDYYDIWAVGDRLLVLSGEEQTRLEVYEGADCIAVAERTLPVKLQEGNWQKTTTGIAYYEPEAGQAVYLNSRLEEMYRIDLPETAEGNPAFAPDGSEIYYCAGQAIYGLDTERGITRLIKSHSYTELTLQGTCLNGKILRCSLEETGDGVYLLTENGTTVYTGAGIQSLSTWEDQYFVCRMDGVTAQYMTGKVEGEGTQWYIDGALLDAGSLGGLVGCSTDENGVVTASFYKLETGLKTAAVELGQVAKPIALWADPNSSSIWLLSSGEDGAALLQWQKEATLVSEEAVYNGPVITAQSPDTQGLDALQDRVDDMNDRYGVTIRIWEKAVATDGDHQLEVEYQVPAISAMLDKLDTLLPIFPETFLRNSANSRIRICIVRTADGADQIIRFWDDRDPFIILPVSEAPEQTLLLELSYIVDSHILGNSSMVDDWETQNPEGFVYGETVDAALLQGETQAFVDEAATQSVADDRARMFWQALQPDNGEMFTAPIMQQKLLLLCRAIRDAWRLERKSDIYTWEQYLTEPIAYDP